MNTLGQILTLTTFGESHGPAIGGVLDGFPSGIAIDTDYVQKFMQRRRPGQSTVTTGRQETDQVEFLSGLLDGVSTGAPNSRTCSVHHMPIMPGFSVTAYVTGAAEVAHRPV